MALVLPFVRKGDDGFEIGVHPPVVVDVEAHLRQAGQDLRLALRAASRVERVHEAVEVPPGGDVRIELPNRSGSGVARVGEERLALGRQLGVQPLKAALRHVYLAADLESRWELRWDRYWPR